jgi:hypothetical protein
MRIKQASWDVSWLINRTDFGLSAAAVALASPLPDLVDDRRANVFADVVTDQVDEGKALIFVARDAGEMLQGLKQYDAAKRISGVTFDLGMIFGSYSQTTPSFRLSQEILRENLKRFATNTAAKARMMSDYIRFSAMIQASIGQHSAGTPRPAASLPGMLPSDPVPVEDAVVLSDEQRDLQLTFAGFYVLIMQSQFIRPSIQAGHGQSVKVIARTVSLPQVAEHIRQRLANPVN